MRIHMISFTENGYMLGYKIRQELLQQFETSMEIEKSSVILTGKPFACSLQEWTAYAFQNADVILYIGACGIAVRSIAPFIQNKYVDPAVLVLDEAGKFCISLLAGHVGGANEWTEKIAAIIHAIPVITTATDIRNCFAVDVFAKKMGLYPFPMEGCKEVSASLVEGKDIILKSDFKITGELPEHLIVGNKGTLGIHISLFPKQQDCFLHTLYLIPRIVSMGIGCKKNTSEEQIEQAVCQSLQELTGCQTAEEVRILKLPIWMKAIRQIASIDIKKEERGLQEFAKHFQIPFETFSKEDLVRVKGEFTGSAFVSQTVGVDNVCERAAVLASRKGRLMMKKKTFHGVTVALAVEDWSVNFA